MLRFSSLKFLLSAVETDQFPPANMPEVAFSGRSNVGKSSLLNLLTRRKGLAKVSKTPGKTRAINFFEVDDTWRLVDLPGYGYARLSKTEIEKWGKTIDTYLCERPNLAGVIQLVDSRHKPTDRDLEMLTWLAQAGIPTIVALTKSDKIGKNLRRTLPDQFRRDWLGNLDWPVVPTSAEKGEGRGALIGEVERLLTHAQIRMKESLSDLEDSPPIVPAEGGEVSETSGPETEMPEVHVRSPRTKPRRKKDPSRRVRPKRRKNGRKTS